MVYHGYQIFMIAAKTFYNLSKTLANHKYWLPLNDVVDIPFQQNPGARRFAKHLTYIENLQKEN